MSNEISNRVIIFKMNDDLNYNSSIIDIQNEYFEKELKENGGKYLVPERKNSEPLHSKDIKENDTILFLYRDMFIACAKIKKDKDNNYCFRVTEKDKKNWYPIKKEEEWKYFYHDEKREFKYYFCFKDIHKVPPISRENLSDFFKNKEGFKSQTAIQQFYIKDEYMDKFNNFINLKKQNYDLVNLNTWKKLIEKLREPSLLKEISLYSYENIHTSFLCNFIDKDNVYGFKDKPFKKFIKLLKDNANSENLKKLDEINIDKIKDFKVLPQTHYRDIDKNMIIPDITIQIDEKYYIIVEAKVCADENIYEKKVTQCEKYYNHFEEEGKKADKKYIYVFLTMRNHTEKKSTEKYIKITFKDIYNEIYKIFYEENKNKKNVNVLYEYLKSFHYLCDSERFNFELDEIPAIFLIEQSQLEKNIEKLKEDIYNIIDYKIPTEINKEDLLYYRYILVLLYNMNIIDKNLVKKCYNNLVWYK